MSNKEEKDVQGNHLRELLRIMKHVFFAVIRVDLVNDKAYILQSIDFPEHMMKEYNWTDYLHRYSRFAEEEALGQFLSVRLLEMYQSGENEFSKELSYKVNNVRKWLTMNGFIEAEHGKIYATILIQKSGREHLQKNLLEKYVSNKCDYLIYLDVGKNSYETFDWGKNTAQMSPRVSENYSSEILKYVKEYVVPEERMKVIHEMSLKHVLEQLEHKNTHSVSYGMMDPVRGYTRKLLEYQYYDKPNQIVLLSRTDITDIYKEAKEKQKELLTALERASTDSLTGILNHQGTIDEVSFCLKEDEGSSALIFIDMDNFKAVNDSLGHIEGDNLLCQVADILRTGVRSDDLAGRVGGDEFLVFLRNVGSKEEVKECAKRLCDKIRRLSIDFGFPISCSMGIAVAPDDGTDYVTLTEAADKRVYRAKARGKNQIVAD